MKSAFHIPLLSFLILFSSSLLAQPPDKQDSSASAFSRMGTHISGFRDYLEENKKVLYKRILLPEEELTAYLKQSLSNLPEESKLHLTAETQIALTYIPASLFEELREINPATLANTYRLSGTRACHSLKDGRYAFELYNGDALIVESAKDAKALKKLRLVRGAAGTTHWEMPLSETQTANFLNEGPELFEDTEIDSGQIYMLTVEELLFIPAEGEPGILFSDKISLLTHLDMLSFYESEASKYLSNQLVDGDVLPGLEKRLIFLSEPQFKQVSLRNDGKIVSAYSDSLQQVRRLDAGSYLLWHPRYHYARYFLTEADLKNHLTSPDYVGQPELLMGAVIRQFGDSLVNHPKSLDINLWASSLIEKEKLDYSLKSLDELSIALSWQREKIYTEEISLALLAYMGEVLCKAKKGKWELVTDENSGLQVPKILSGKEQSDDVMELALKYWPND